MIQYGPLLEDLLGGGFVCQVRDSHNHERLQNEALREQLDQYLRPLNRRLASSADGAVWYLAWLELNQELRDSLSQQLRDTLDSLMPMLTLMQLVQDTTGSDRVLSAHDVLNRHDLAARIENNPSLRQQLQQLCTTRLFQSQSEDTGGQLKLVFERLRQQGYLLQPHKDRQHFVVTGKIDYLLELVRFIQEEERIQLDDEPAAQQEALLS
ncbi:condensin complex protein MksE [Thiopseudomonas denitrificans]|uniref:DUF4194 domain-containing protein n=1 Tax=Thiopseudomonas denitrificans TaxID=1501432 RepID=A0A4R6U629_9GAMM|nr:hypothetical protein [Thiopseudomonas denitrificans]TDQ38494.1 hypothetical protein DFQ45_10468 [Thiopseudomonas denitrificans]